MEIATPGTLCESDTTTVSAQLTAHTSQPEHRASYVYKFACRFPSCMMRTVTYHTWHGDCSRSVYVYYL